MGTGRVRVKSPVEKGHDAHTIRNKILVESTLGAMVTKRDPVSA